MNRMWQLDDTTASNQLFPDLGRDPLTEDRHDPDQNQQHADLGPSQGGQRAFELHANAPAPTKPSTVDSRMLMSQRNMLMPANVGATCGIDALGVRGGMSRASWGCECPDQIEIITIHGLAHPLGWPALNRLAADSEQDPASSSQGLTQLGVPRLCQAVKDCHGIY